MVKKSGSKKRRIRQGVQRHKIGPTQVNGNGSYLLNSEGKIGHLIVRGGKNCYNYVTKACTHLCLIPLCKCYSEGSKFDFAPLWRRTISILLILFYVSYMLYRFGVTIYFVTEGKLNTVTILCGTTFLVLFLPVCTASGSSWATLDLKGLLNSWESVLRSIEEVRGEHVEILSSVQLCFEIIAMTCASQVSGINTAAFSMVFEDLPASVFLIFKRLGRIPETSHLPTIAWQIGFFPLEVFIAAPPMCALAFNSIVIRKGQAILQLYVDCLRQIKIRDKESWMEVERLYQSMKIYNIIYMKWLKSVIVPAIFSACAVITITLYVTCRPADMRLIIYFAYPLNAVVVLLLFTVFRICYDAVVAKRAGDGVLGNPQSRTAGYFSRLEPAEKREMMRRARALQPVYIGMGEFSEITLEVSMSIWDEILNQLLFLLSL